MLTIRRLTKNYPNGVRALENANLEIPPGVFGLLGPNGAGKSTLMKIAATLLQPDSGFITLGDIDVLAHPRAARQVLGYLPQEFGFHPTLTAEQTLNYLAKLKGVTDRRDRRAQCDALLERVNLSNDRARRVGDFSGGMRQRLGIAQAVIGRPKLLIVDEPTAGLDPEERNRFHNLLIETAGTDAVIVLSTHIVSDIAGLCQNMAIMCRGQVLTSCAPTHALDEMADAVWSAQLSRERAHVLSTKLNFISRSVLDGQVRVRVYSPGLCPTEEFVLTQPTLEDYYLLTVATTGPVQ